MSEPAKATEVARRDNMERDAMFVVLLYLRPHVRGAPYWHAYNKLFHSKEDAEIYANEEYDAIAYRVFEIPGEKVPP